MQVILKLTRTALEPEPEDGTINYTSVSELFTKCSAIVLLLLYTLIPTPETTTIRGILAGLFILFIILYIVVFGSTYSKWINFARTLSFIIIFWTSVVVTYYTHPSNSAILYRSSDTVWITFFVGSVILCGLYSLLYFYAINDWQSGTFYSSSDGDSNSEKGSHSSQGQISSIAFDQPAQSLGRPTTLEARLSFGSLGRYGMSRNGNRSNDRITLSGTLDHMGRQIAVDRFAVGSMSSEGSDLGRWTLDRINADPNRINRSGYGNTSSDKISQGISSFGRPFRMDRSTYGSKSNDKITIEALKGSMSRPIESVTGNASSDKVLEQKSSDMANKSEVTESISGQSNTEEIRKVLGPRKMPEFI
jgi:hypothetical protein